MLNILISSKCNRNCEYCFASDIKNLDNHNNPQFMNRSLFKQCLDFVKASGGNEIRILGGEPTMHEEFTEFCNLAISESLRIKVFTNGLMPCKTVDYLKNLDDKIVKLLVNINSMSSYTIEEQYILRNNLKSLGKKVNLGFNICTPEFDASHCLKLIKALDLYPGLRLGIAHPTLSGTNKYFDWNYSRKVAFQIIEFAKLADDQDIIIGLDCGFVLCMFEDFLHELINRRIDFNFSCHAVLDVLPNGSILHCLPIWDTNSTNLNMHTGIDSLKEHFNNKFQLYRNFGISDECRNCKYFRSNHCSGGCLARIIKSWN